MNKDTYIIRPAEPADAESVKALEVAEGLSEWSVADYKAEAIRPGSVFLIAIAAGAIAGLIVVRLITRSKIKDDSVDLGKRAFGEAEILNIAVAQEHRRHGVGTDLVDHVLDSLNGFDRLTVHLEVRESNDTAIGFYEKRGFQRVGRRPAFYRNPEENAVLMQLVLPQPSSK